MGSHTDGGWLPFKTAPLDETPILVFMPGRGVFECSLLPSGIGFYFCWRNMFSGDFESYHPETRPTHWMPLPPPPSSIQHNNTDLVPARRADEHGDAV